MNSYEQEQAYLEKYDEQEEIIRQHDKEQREQRSEALDQKNENRAALETEQQQQADADLAETQANLNEDGTPKSTHQTLDPSEFGIKENLQEAGNVIVGGLGDAWNNTISLGKLFDPEFYQANDPEKNPYKFDSDWMIDQDPQLTKTRWGGVLRGILDLGIGFVGTGGVASGLRRSVNVASKGSKIPGLTKLAGGLNVLSKFSKSNKAMELGYAAVKGAAVDAWDTDSHGSTMSDALKEVAPTWAAPIFEPLSTRKDMSPAQRTLLNMLEGLGLGVAFDIAGTAIRKRMVGVNQEKAAKKVAEEAKKKGVETPKTASKIKQELDVSENREYATKTTDILNKTEAKYTADQFKTLKRNNLIPEDMTIDEWKATWKTPTEKQIKDITLSKYGDITEESIDKVSKQIRPKWSELEPYEQNLFMQKRAADLDIDWGPERDYSRFSIKQANQATEIGVDQLSEDIIIGKPRLNSFYEMGSNVFENQALSGTTVPMKAVRDQIEIRGDWTAKRGSNRAPFSEAAIRRMASTGHAEFDQIEKIAKNLVDNEDLKALYSGPAKVDLQNDFFDASQDLKLFLDASGNSRVADSSEEALIKFLKSQSEFNQFDKINEVSVLNHRQQVMADVMLGQMTQEIRDLSKASLSVSKVIDTAVDGGMIDSIMARYKALARWRGRTSAIVSQRLRQFGSPDAKDVKTIADYAEEQAAQRVDTLVKVLKNDDDDGSLFEAFQYFSAASNGKPMTFKDMETFFERRLRGYAGKSQHHKNLVVSELQTMGINSMLSGPKTPVRAAIGTGINTVMKPAAAIIGTTLDGNRGAMRAQFASLGALLETIPEAWRKAVADFNTYIDNDGNFRGFKANKQELEFQAIENFYKTQGNEGDRIAMSIAGMVRGLNKNPFLNYGPRIMKASDTFFGQLIGRARQREKAFLEVFDTMEQQSKVLSSGDLRTATRLAEAKFEKDIWTSDGKLKDELANYTWDEAALKTDMPAWANNIQAATEKLPLIKPFVGLFMKTGVNALQLTSKYTPILNRAIREVHTIKFKDLGDPELLQYGIKTQHDLDIARAVIRGREAIGAATVATAGMLYLNGSLSGNGPPDHKLRKAWIQSGAWQPRSIKIGDTWVSYESLEPFNSFLSMVADVGDAQAQMGEDWADEHLKKMAFLISSNVTNKTFLAGLMNLQDLLTGQGLRPEAVIANLVNNQIPLSSMRNEVGKVFNPGMRELEHSFTETIRNRNLWADLLVSPDGKLPYRYDILDGKPLRDWDPFTRFINSTLPFNINTTTSQTRELLFRSGLNLEQTFNTGPGGISLDEYPDLKSRFQYLTSQQNIEKQLEKLFQNPQIMQSIMDMEADHTAGRRFNPSKRLHNEQIKAIFRTAKQNAWLQLSNEDARIKQIEDQKNLRALEERARKQGTNDYANEINDLRNLAK